jgi:hypothetical protein
MALFEKNTEVLLYLLFKESILCLSINFDLR